MDKNYIKLTDDDLKKLHKELLLILKEVDRVCRKNNIKYFLSFGTLLGAIRHNGFIPWDDDMDVCMLREDYDRFCEVCKNDLGNEFLLQTQDTDEYYNWTFGKVRLLHTDYIRVGQEHLKQKRGICIDIIPLDNIPENRIIQNLVGNTCRVLRRVLWSQVGMVTEKNIIKRNFYKILNMIPRKLVIHIFNSISKAFNNKETEYLISNHFNYNYSVGKNLILKKEWFNSSIRVDFEGYKFSIPSGYDYILKNTYGDYMKLPPKEKQIGHSYSVYIKFLDGSELKI